MKGRSGRRHDRAWRLSELLTRFGFIVGAVAATVGLFRLPGWLAAAAVAFPFGIALAGQVMYDRERHIDTCKRYLEDWPSPRLPDIDVFAFNVHRSRRAERHCPPGHPQCREGSHQPPYVRRSQSAVLGAQLQEHQFALVIGEMLSGKSRFALEVARQLLPGHRLVVPRSGLAINEVEVLRRSPLLQADTVVWLDDVEGLVSVAPGAEGLDRRTLVEWRTRGTPRVIATLSRTAYDRLSRATGDVDRHVARTIRELGHVVTVAVGHDRAERAEIARLYPGEEAQNGLGRWLFAADRLEERLRSGATLSPAGHAVTRAAVFWYRCTGVHALSEPTLKHLYQALCQSHPEHLSPAAWEPGVKWATEPVIEGLDETSLLLNDSDGRGRAAYRAHSAILDAPELAGARIPQAIWEAVTSLTGGWGALRVGFFADKEGNDVAAERAWARALADEDLGVAAQAAWFLGLQHLEKGHSQEARDAFERAIADGPEELRLDASEGLGRARLAEGDLWGARDALARVVEAGDATDPDLQARAAFHLSEVCIRLGDRDGAVEALRTARGAEDDELKVRAAFRLGDLSLQLGRNTEARAAFERVVRSERVAGPGLAIQAAFHLGRACEGLEDWQAAAEAFALGMRSEQPSLGVEAAISLGRIRETHLSDPVGAELAYKFAANHGEPPVKQEAWEGLGRVQEAQGKLAKALSSFQRTADLSDPASARRSGRPLEEFLKRRTSDKDDALTARACLQLGQLFEAQARPGHAILAYRDAVLADPQQADRVAPRLESLYQRATEEGARERSVAALGALELSHPTGSDPAWSLELGRRYRSVGDLRDAHRLYEAATRTGDTRIATKAWLELGQIYEQDRKFENASAAYERATASEDQRVAGQATVGMNRIEDKLRRAEEGPGREGRNTREALNDWRSPPDPGRGATDFER